MGVGLDVAQLQGVVAAGAIDALEQIVRGQGPQRQPHLSPRLRTTRLPSFTDGIDPFSMLAVIVRGSTPSAAAASARVMTALREARKSSNVTDMSLIALPAVPNQES
ncbi:hypothetical protein BAU01nite_34500 [Brevibacterium aurantiacum]|nr:hypothetical protein BAU01nite_34500 [Brevibacterium aurantiacum]